MAFSCHGREIVPLPALPDVLALHRRAPARYPHLLVSASSGTPQGRFDILFAFPQGSLSLGPQGLIFDGLDEELRDLVTGDSFLAALDTWWHQAKTPPVVSELPFTGGWFLFLGYELAAEVEPVLKLPPATDGLPIATACRFPAAVIIDWHLREASIVVEQEYRYLIENIQRDIEALTGEVEAPEETVVVSEIREDDPQDHLDNIERIKRYIVDGDIFQANLSRCWRATLKTGANDAALYARLKQANPGPFSALATFPDGAIISSSPERLVSVRQGVVQTRPIAGTRPRSAEESLDAELSQELIGHPKERAEHIMLIDLERNDLGRVCRPGTVKVDELMVLESYRHVHHIVSNVQGELLPNVTPGDVIRAVFPGGTITGCPKVRCMEILAELEQTGRGAYTGSLGYLNRDGCMDLNILIRTLVRNGSQLTFRAGGGIVADSQPQRELEETRAKARGLLMALGVDVDRAPVQ